MKDNIMEITTTERAIIKAMAGLGALIAGIARTQATLGKLVAEKLPCLTEIEKQGLLAHIEKSQIDMQQFQGAAERLRVL